ncbi:MAG: gluconate 2-dehydrogenase subunit 3 family protein [Alphaproteobacteria bacterium]|nr:gluconate 2-dehydrogenase subunit 3 family protein [Alphaproteobacteria bacterium]HPF46707.1 gluconate 2-dehydrogenase subunit 3 family protein [Emcibacteraceae bacterium]
MNKNYISRINRRDSLKWLGSLTSYVVIGGVVVSCDAPSPELPDVKKGSNWPDMKFGKITGPKYGQDPDLLNPTTPWSLTLDKNQLNLVAHLSDIICPADDNGPSAVEVGVPDVIDEWVSAPYETQHNDRELILNGLQWLDDEANRRFKKGFMDLGPDEQIQIIDDIAYSAKADDPEFEHAVLFFAKLRTLVFGAYFTSPEGMTDIGYMGNTPILGDYPGPTGEAMAHLNEIIANMPG